MLTGFFSCNITTKKYENHYYLLKLFVSQRFIPVLLYHEITSELNNKHFYLVMKFITNATVKDGTLLLASHFLTLDLV